MKKRPVGHCPCVQDVKIFFFPQISEVQVFDLQLHRDGLQALPCQLCVLFDGHHPSVLQLLCVGLVIYAGHGTYQLGMGTGHWPVWSPAMGPGTLLLLAATSRGVHLCLTLDPGG